jgi:hypothetical protein
MAAEVPGFEATLNRLRNDAAAGRRPYAEVTAELAAWCDEHHLPASPLAISILLAPARENADR